MSKSVDNAVQLEQAKTMLKILQVNVDNGDLGKYTPQMTELVEEMQRKNDLYRVEINEPNWDELKGKALTEAKENHEKWLKVREEYQKSNREEHAQLQKQFNIAKKNRSIAWAPIYQMFEDTWGLRPIRQKNGKLKLVVVLRDENGKLIKHWEK